MACHGVARGQIGSSPSGDLGWRPGAQPGANGHSPAASGGEDKGTYTFSRMLSGDGGRLSLPRLQENLLAQTHKAGREPDRHQQSPRLAPTLEHIVEVQEAPVLADESQGDDE